jgi:hypothetical protein
MDQFIPFDKFRAGLGPPADEPNPSDRRAYLAHHYRDAVVHHSYVDDEGHYIDCMKPGTQPGGRSDEGIAKPPDFIAAGGAAQKSVGSGASQPEVVRTDRFGNVMACPPGLIPVQRVTPERLERIGPLENFFQKAPGGGALPPPPFRTRPL